jgi:hypothetical protein
MVGSLFFLLCFTPLYIVVTNLVTLLALMIVHDEEEAGCYRQWW